MQLHQSVTEEKMRRFAAGIKVLLMDVDGVLTNGHLYLIPGPYGKLVETKGFDSQDGIALRWLSWFNIRTGVISGRESPATAERASQAGMTWVFQGHIEKIPLFEQMDIRGYSGHALFAPPVLDEFLAMLTPATRDEFLKNMQRSAASTTEATTEAAA